MLRVFGLFPVLLFFLKKNSYGTLMTCFSFILLPYYVLLDFVYSDMTTVLSILVSSIRPLHVANNMRATSRQPSFSPFCAIAL
jgi:hypothetical protein